MTRRERLISEGQKLLLDAMLRAPSGIASIDDATADPPKCSSMVASGGGEYPEDLLNMASLNESPSAFPDDPPAARASLLSGD